MLVDRVRPSFPDEKALNEWMKKQMAIVLQNFAESQDKNVLRHAHKHDPSLIHDNRDNFLYFFGRNVLSFKINAYLCAKINFISMNKETIAAADFQRKAYAKPRIRVVEIKSADLICTSTNDPFTPDPYNPWG